MIRLLAAALLMPAFCAAQAPRAGDAPDAADKALVTPAPSLTEMTPKEIYQSEGNAVVLILCAGADGKGQLGSGSIIDAAGHVLTNAHVVFDAASDRPFQTIRVYFKPPRLTGDNERDLVDPVRATVAKYDRKLDLTILELDKHPKGAIMPLGDSASVQPGDPVVAIGHPEQGGLWTLTTGVVGSVIAGLDDVPGKDVFQTDASINRGNSGGPLIDRRGEMIGINTSIARKGEDGLAITAVNFSIKSGVVKKWLIESGADVALAEPTGAARTEAAQAAAVSTAAAASAQAPAAAAPAPATPPAAPPTPPQAEAPNPTAQAAPPPAPKPRIVTPAKPYRIEDVIEKEISEMEDLEKEMRDEVDKRRGMLNPAPPSEP